MKKPTITLHLWTERFLGSADRAVSLLSLIKTVDGGNWVPDKWGQFEPVKNSFKQGSEEQIIRDWVEERHGRISNSMYFTKTSPGLFLGVTSWRGRVSDLNYVWLEIEANEFDNSVGTTRLKHIASEFVLWSDAVYATAHHSTQRHYRSVPGNPTKRLDQLNWMTFLGAPYLRMLGERVRQCPFYSCEPVGAGLLLTADERPDSPAMREANDRLLSLERCLGEELFPAADYPEVPCRVPDFDLRETQSTLT